MPCIGPIKTQSRIDAEAMCRDYPDEPSKTLARRLAEQHGMSIETARSMIRKVRGNCGSKCRREVKDQVPRPPQPAGLNVNSPRPESCEVIEKSNDCTLTYYGVEIKTVEELLKAQGVDLRLWEVVEQIVNNYEVTLKRNKGQDGAGKWQGEELCKTGNRQIKVKLRRKAPKPIQDGIAELLKDLKPIKTSIPPKRPRADRHMIELGLYDHHFGKLCWGDETSTNYDLRIAEAEWKAAVDGMLARIAGFNVEKIVMPIGNDFFHANDFHSQTANLTRVESVDDRFSKVFRTGCRSVQYTIEKALEIAPIELGWIPGNHDRHTSWYLMEVLRAMFSSNAHVTIDNGPRQRKYVAYGPALLGYVHGEDNKHNDLPTLMATEEPLLWSKSKFRSWRIGHWHKRKEVRHTVGDTFNGVEVRIFPSLCGTDSWHYRKGYTGNARMAEVHIWSESDGPVGYFIQHAQEPLVLAEKTTPSRNRTRSATVPKA
jgi:hypothetical protein